MKLRRVISLLPAAALLFASGLTGQPVTIPNQTHPTFNPTDLDATFAGAQGNQSQSGWEQMTQAGHKNLEAAWEAGVQAAIDAEVLANTSSDFYNANPEYRHYIRSQLQIQEARQKTAWLQAATQTTDPQSEAAVLKMLLI